MIRISLQINQHDHTLNVDPQRTLLHVLREELTLTGTKYGCGDGKCGVCTVLVDGNPVQACQIVAADLSGKAVTTVEGLARTGRLHAVQAAFLETAALQCGYCTPGMIMSAVALLAVTPDPDDAAIQHALQDNLCRCGAHPRIVDAVKQAATWLQADAWPELALAPPLPPTLPEPPDIFDEGLLVAYPDPDVADATFGEDAPPPDRRVATQIGPLVHIAEDGAIRVFVGKAEVGQNMRASVAQLVTVTLAAFAFAHYEFRGKKALFYLVLLQLMIPTTALLAPNFSTIRWMGLFDTRLAIAIPYFGSAFGTFLLRQVFLEIPRDLVDAGVIDGCRWWQLLRHIYLPPAVPTLIAFGLSSVAWHWNEFLWPLVITNSDKARPLTAGLVRFTQLGEIGAQWSLLSAATLIVILPLFVVFLLFQKRFIQSFVYSGIK